ncbi:hypothetical protein [Dactylosporangium sp. CS-033363]|uniref:hypothetical protein n=1 Tax=Dactylosporangium sp. CS-033363 TaxID=3239935 RepID=UPI003D918151
MSTQPPDPNATGAYQPQPAAQYQTPAAQTAPVSGAAQQYQAVQAPAAAPAPPPDAKKARGLLEPYRELTAFGLLGAVALILLAGLVRVLTGLFNSFLATATASFGNVIGFEVILLPIVAVVLVLLLDPVTPRAKMVVIGALVEYAIAAVLGLVLLLAGLIGDFQSEGPIGWALGGFLEHLAGLGLIGLGLFLTARIFLGAYSAPKPVAAPYQQGYGYQQQGYGYPQQQYAQQTGYVTGAQPAAAQQQAYPAAYAQQQPATGGWQTTGSTPAVAAQPQQQPQAYAQPQAQPGYVAPTTGAPTTGAPTTGAPAAAPTSGGYAAPGYATPGYAQPATPAYTQPAAPVQPPAAEPAQPASGPPLSSPFAAYTAPAPTPVTDEPVSASPADAGASTPPGGFAQAGWPGGHSTPPASSEETGTAAITPAHEEGTAAITPAHEEGTAAITPAHEEGTAAITPAEEEGTAVLTPAADPDATQAAPVVKPADEDPDRTTVLRPGDKKDDGGDETQRTQAIPPSN